MSLEEKIKDLGRNFIIFLKGEDELDENNPDRPLYTKEELEELYKKHRKE